jgi:hypothetical protein
MKIAQRHGRRSIFIEVNWNESRNDGREVQDRRDVDVIIRPGPLISIVPLSALRPVVRSALADLSQPNVSSGNRMISGTRRSIVHSQPTLGTISIARRQSQGGLRLEGRWQQAALE